MDIYILILSLFIFATSFYISIRVFSEINSKSIILSLLMSLFFSLSTYKVIYFLNLEEYESYIKFSFFMTLFFFSLLLIKISTLDNLYFIKNYHKIFVERDKFFINIIFIFSYFITYFLISSEKFYFITFILTIFLSIIVAYSIYLMKLLIPAIIIFSLFNNFYIFNYLYISLISLTILLNLIKSLKLKYFNKLLKSQVDKINYTFENKETNIFISKFIFKTNKNISEDIVIHYKNEEDSINYFIKFNIESHLNRIINENKKNIFLLNSTLIGTEINICFSDLSFYCSDNDFKTKLENLTQINVPEEMLNLEDFVKQQFRLKQILKY